MKIFNHAAVALATGISIFASTFTPAQAETDWRQETNAYKTASIEKGSADQKTSSKSRTAKASEKPVTVVLGLPCNQAELKDMAAKLKAACGSGGTAKDGAVEIQGDHRDRVAEYLRKAGHEVRFAGG